MDRIQSRVDDAMLCTMLATCGLVALLMIPPLVVICSTERRAPLWTSLWLYGTILSGLPLGLLLRATFARADQYLLLHSMADADTTKPWWEQLAQVMAASEPDIVDPFEWVQLNILKVVVLSAKIIASVKATWIDCRSQFSEGGIALA